MKNWIKGMLAGAVLLSLSGAARAEQLTSYFYIQNLDANYAGGGSYTVYAKNYTIPNPKGCANTGKAEIYVNAAAADRDLMNKTLLAAFMAGRQVRLSISTATCSANNYPAYALVRLDADG
jgi:hypothetical protein